MESLIADGPLSQVELEPLDQRALEDEADRNQLLLRRAGRLIVHLRKAVADKEAELRAADVRVQELEHRIGNELQILSALIRLQAGDGPHLPENCAACVTRLGAVADLHATLTSRGCDPVEVSDLLRSIVRQIGSAFRLEERIVIKLAADPIALKDKTAQTLGLMVNEAVTNSLKHAFPDGRTGTVRVTLGRDTSAIRLSVWDDGIGAGPGTAEPRLRVIRALATQLGGQLSLPAVGEGFRVDCVFVSD